MLTVDLIYQRDCPNVAQARDALNAAFCALGLPPRWLEWDVADAATPGEFRSYGSPTVLVNGRDVAGEEDGHCAATPARCCRVYASVDGLVGVPPVQVLVRALGAQAARTAPMVPRQARWHGLAVVPSLGLAAVPFGLCPACIAGYFGVFGALGLGFLLELRYLLPLTLLALAIALGSLAWQARTRHGFGPLLLGSVGAVLLVPGQFASDGPALVWSGAAVLFSASVWNVWPGGRGSHCADCTPRVGEQALHDARDR